MLVDVHCHLDHILYKKDIDKVIERAKNVIIITNGVEYNTNEIALELSKKYPNVKASLGLYPEDALDRETEKENFNLGEKRNINDILKQIESNKDRIIAIGEVGLDLFHGKDIKKQEESLSKLINLAIKLDKPVCLHSRKAEKELLDFLEKFKISPDKIILHCFSGNSSLIKKAVERGYNFSIPSNVTRSDSFKNLVKLAPINKILTETDGPYLSPIKSTEFIRNEPISVKEGLKIIAKIKNITENQAENIIFENYKRIYE